LDAAAGATLVLVKDGVRYRLLRDEPVGNESAGDPWAKYDPERLMEGVQAAAGSISEAEAEALIANIYRWREEGSRRPGRT
jgi:hypothetical protein